MSCRETSFGFIKLVTADTKVCKDPINHTDIMQLQKPLQVTKIMRHENDAWIFWNVASCIFILVECDELAIIVKLFKDGFRMAAAAKSAIDINSMGDDVQTIHRFFEENRCMIIGIWNLGVGIWFFIIHDFPFSNS